MIDNAQKIQALLDTVLEGDDEGIEVAQVAKLSAALVAIIEGPQHGWTSAVVLVAAAGNESEDTRLEIPAAYPEVITVSGIVDADGQPGGLGGPDLCLNQPDDTFAFFSSTLS